MRYAIAWTVLAACSHDKPILVNHAPREVKPKAVPCPSKSYKELASVVRPMWGEGAEVDLCIELVRDGTTTWWLEGQADAPPDTMHQIPTKRAVVDPNRRVVLWHGPDNHAPGFGFDYMANQAKQNTVDLDGDGKDEALYARTTGEGGVSGTELIAVFFEPTPVVMSIPLGYGSLDGFCDGTWSVIGKRIEIEQTGTLCEGKRHHSYERRGNAFEEQ